MVIKPSNFFVTPPIKYKAKVAKVIGILPMGIDHGDKTHIIAAKIEMKEIF